MHKPERIQQRRIPIARPSAPTSPLARRKSSAEDSLRKPSEDLDGNLRSHLDHPSARNLKIVGRIIGGAAERYEKMILPARHSGMRGRLERAPRQEERRGHDIEFSPQLSGDG